MLYHINNNNNYIYVLDIQLWIMHCLLIYILQGSLYLSKLLITKLYIYMYLYVLYMYVKSNQSNNTNQCKYCDFHVIILPVMGVFN